MASGDIPLGKECTHLLLLDVTFMVKFSDPNGLIRDR